jgi:hypothetical protein
MIRPSVRILGSLIAAICAGVQSAAAQDWSWVADANVFAGYNYQQRRFADFRAWESQNWFMFDLSHDDSLGRLTIDTMVSLEPLTLGHLVFSGDPPRRVDAGGSPQLFQTGESYQQIPLSNVQHPHDLVMALGASYRIEGPRAAYMFAVDLVGAPALGPIPFMHRDSARDNPQTPLTHHWMDATHVSYGVVTGGIAAGGFTVEASAFRGEEPDENRYNIDTPRLDSYSARLGWSAGPWSAQVSGGHLHVPEWFEPYDETRLTASAGFGGAVKSHPLAATLAWGENRDAVVINGVSDNFLFEWDLRATGLTSFYGRAEVVEKQIIGLGYHPLGFVHAHVYSHIDALTLGGVRDLLSGRDGRFGVGADITLYHMSPDLLPYWAGSHSYHVFLRWRPTGGGHPHH